MQSKELKKNLLRECSFCGGEAELIEYIETVDGRGDKIARVRCKCGCEIHLTMREFSQAEDDFGYKGGYYSQNKKFWNGMHQRLIDKWNNRATEAEISAKAQREIVEWCFDNKVDFAILERYADKEGVVDCVLKHFTSDQLKERET